MKENGDKKLLAELWTVMKSIFLARKEKEKIGYFKTYFSNYTPDFSVVYVKHSGHI